MIRVKPTAVYGLYNVHTPRGHYPLSAEDAVVLYRDLRTALAGGFHVNLAVIDAEIPNQNTTPPEAPGQIRREK